MALMQAEIISIGDELTSGQRLDTNSQWLSQQLGDLGIRALFHTTVGDDLAANVRVFREAATRADVVIATGGLGPTADDLTREAVAQLLGVELVLDEPSLQYIRGLFARRKRTMPERNVVQAMFPQGARVVPNHHGTAPGIDADVPRDGASPSRVFCLPGVPAEMKEMWAASVEPALRLALGESAGRIVHRVIRCFGVGESDLEAMLPDLIARTRLPLVGITVSQATISLRITAAGRTREEALAAMEPTVETIYTKLGNLIFGEGEEELEHAVLRLLASRGQTLATAECGSGGQVAHWLSEASSGSPVYQGGEVVRQTFENSAEAVAQLANACRERFRADLALAIGPYPTNSSDDAQHVYFAVATEAGVLSRTAVFAGHPDVVRPLTAKRALNHLRLHLA
jgi:nicotinamide-nucleotide amidase